MSEYRPQTPRIKTPDFKNEDDVQSILESGTPEDIEALRAAGNLDQETVELYRHFAQLRRATIEQQHQELAERINREPQATAEELNAGTYREGIESQILNTVFRLRAKGYRTFSSGFGKENVQKLSLDAPQFDQLVLPDAVIKELEYRHVTVTITPTEIRLIFATRATLAEIEEAWNLIEAAIPNLEMPAKPTMTGQAISFREKQKPTNA